VIAWFNAHPDHNLFQDLRIWVAIKSDAGYEPWPCPVYNEPVVQEYYRWRALRGESQLIFEQNKQQAQVWAGIIGPALVPASRIRWTQNSVNWYTKKGIDLDMLAGDIGSYGFRGAIDVVEIEGIMYSLDNRRLTVSKMLDIEVPVNRLDINDPKVLARFNRVFTTDTEGLSIKIRGSEIRMSANGEILDWGIYGGESERWTK
jgi:hypothetical protein